MEKTISRKGQQYPIDDRLAERLWAKVERSDGCWRWKGSHTHNGYAQIHVKLDRGKWSATVAHRLTYVLEVGPIGDGLVLDHLCRNRGCVNPYHLEPTTDLVNILRGTGFAARHAKKTHCPAGHAYDAANTHVDKRNMRHCRACDASRKRLRVRRKEVQ